MPPSPRSDPAGDETALHITVACTVSESGTLLKRREWAEPVPQDFN